MLAVQIWAFLCSRTGEDKDRRGRFGRPGAAQRDVPRHTNGGHQAVHGRTGQPPGCGQPARSARDRRGPASEHVVPSGLGWLGTRTKGAGLTSGGRLGRPAQRGRLPPGREPRVRPCRGLRPVACIQPGRFARASSSMGGTPSGSMPRPAAMSVSAAPASCSRNPIASASGSRRIRASRSMATTVDGGTRQVLSSALLQTAGARPGLERAEFVAVPARPVCPSPGTGRLDRPHRQDEPFGDLGVGRAVAGQLDDLAFAAELPGRGELGGGQHR